MFLDGWTGGITVARHNNNLQYAEWNHYHHLQCKNKSCSDALKKRAASLVWIINRFNTKLIFFNWASCPTGTEPLSHLEAVTELIYLGYLTSREDCKKGRNQCWKRLEFVTNMSPSNSYTWQVMCSTNSSRGYLTVPSWAMWKANAVEADHRSDGVIKLGKLHSYTCRFNWVFSPK